MLLGLLLALADHALAAADPAVTAVFNAFSLPLPRAYQVVVCHGFACKFRTPISLSAADQVRLRTIMAAGAASAEAERRAVSAAVGWFGRRIAPEAGTTKAQARAGMKFAGDPTQFDCVDSSTNTTSVLLILDELQLLRHHTVDAPVSRSLFAKGFPHTTAVLREHGSDVRWSIDSWTRASGQPAEVLPLEQWLELP
jgi:hypothetical protein